MTVSVIVLVIGTGCAHSPDTSHVHHAVSQFMVDTPVIIQGGVSDAITGNPIPFATVYLIDLRPECWGDLQQHTARLGTADRDGNIDLSATWSTKRELDFDAMPITSFDWVRDIHRLAEVAEERCRAGEPVNAAVVVDAWPYHGRYALLSSKGWPPYPDGVMVHLGNWTLEPLPEGYWCHGDIALAEIAAVSPRGESR